MKKIFMNVYVIAFGVLMSTAIFAMSGLDEMEEAWEAPLKVVISNQTNSNIFIELENGAKIIIVDPHTADTWFEVLPTYMQGGFARRPLAAQYPVEIQTKQGKFDLKWVVGAYADRGAGQLNLNKKDSDERFDLAKPLKPIVIFQEGESPVIKERDEKPIEKKQPTVEQRPETIRSNEEMVDKSLISSPRSVASSRSSENIEEPVLIVTVSNQTKNAITIEEEGIKINVPSFANTSFKLKPLPPAGSGDISKDIVKIIMNDEQYYVSWAVFMRRGKGAGTLSLYKEKTLGAIFLNKPHNPIIIFEEGKNLPAIKEREDQ